MLSSHTTRILAGFAAMLIALVAYSAYTLRQVEGLRRIQSEVIERHRKDSLQLLRIQNDLNLLSVSLRDAQESSYGVAAYRQQFERIRRDLDDAMAKESALAPPTRPPAVQSMLAATLTEFREAYDAAFAAAGAGKENEAKQILKNGVQPRQSAMSAAVARLLVQNYDAEEQASAEIHRIHDTVESNVHRFFWVVFAVLAATSAALVYFNRQMFRSLAQLAEQKSTLARKVITLQEDVFRSLARELHDEFGQILTAIGAMLSRSARYADPRLTEQLQETRAAAQEALEKVRGLSQALHPVILDDYGLERGTASYLQTFTKQTGIDVTYEPEAGLPEVRGEAAIHVYRVLQEALNNVARHSGSQHATVRLRREAEELLVEVEDRGKGLVGIVQNKPGLGLIAMRERAGIIGGRLEVLNGRDGGLLVRLHAPLPPASAEPSKLAEASVP